MSRPENSWPVRVLPGEGQACEQGLHRIFELPMPFSLSVPLRSGDMQEATAVSSCCHARLDLVRPTKNTPGAHLCVRCARKLPMLQHTYMEGETGRDGFEFMSSSLHRFLDQRLDPLTLELVADGLAALVGDVTAAYRELLIYPFSVRYAWMRLVSERLGAIDFMAAPHRNPSKNAWAELRAEAQANPAW